MRKLFSLLLFGAIHAGAAMDSPSITREHLEQKNAEYFLPRSLHLELLKDYPHAIPTLTKWLYNEWNPYDTSLTKESFLLSLQAPRYYGSIDLRSPMKGYSCRILFYQKTSSVGVF